ncbi:MAG: hypothetical protein ABIP39_03735 [Polyangiaceae bacterium]
MARLSETDWSAVNTLRGSVMGRPATTVLDAAQSFTEDFAKASSSIVLARVFLVVPFAKLPTDDRAFGTRAKRSSRAASPSRWSPPSFFSSSSARSSGCSSCG